MCEERMNSQHSCVPKKSPPAWCCALCVWEEISCIEPNPLSLHIPDIVLRSADPGQAPGVWSDIT